MSVLIGKKHFMCSRTVKSNEQGEHLHACWQWAAIGDVLVNIPSNVLRKVIFSDGVLKDDHWLITCTMV